jgi:hypothetical protein
VPLYRTLGYGGPYGYGKNRDNKLEHNIIIIDEGSMINNDIFYRLFYALDDSSKIIIIAE